MSNIGKCLLCGKNTPFWKTLGFRVEMPKQQTAVFVDIQCSDANTGAYVFCHECKKRLVQETLKIWDRMEENG
jgi:hypothetical protein